MERENVKRKGFFRNSIDVFENLEINAPIKSVNIATLDEFKDALLDDTIDGMIITTSIVLTDFNWDATVTLGSIKIISGETNNIVLTLPQEIIIGSETVFSNIQLETDGTIIFASGYPFIFNDGVASNGGISIYGGKENDITNGDTNIIINSGYVYNICGGGSGENAIVNGNTNIIVNDATVSGIFGGGGNAIVVGDANIIVNRSMVYGAITGGGYNGNVNGNTNITVSVSDCGAGIIGGGVKASIGGSSNIVINNSYVRMDICGGGYGGDIGGNTNITINGNASNIIGGVIGGGVDGNVIGTTHILFTNGLAEYIIGGSLGETDDVNVSTGDTYITMESGMIRNIIVGGGYIRSTVNGSTNILMSGGSTAIINAGMESDGTITGNTNVTITGNPSIIVGIYGRYEAVVNGVANLTYDSYGTSTDRKEINSLFNIDNVYMVNTYFTFKEDITVNTYPCMNTVGTLFLTSGELLIAKSINVNAALGGGDGTLLVQNDSTFTVNGTVAPQIKVNLVTVESSAQVFVAASPNNITLVSDFMVASNLQVEQADLSDIKRVRIFYSSI